MVLSTEKMDELKKVELAILQRFIQACEILGLRYYIVYGTLLGAVRHRGFIPWDDDIDVAMPRKDYDQFVLHGQALLPPELFVQTVLSDPYYVNSYMKIRDSETTFIETCTKSLPINHGVYIDVFPLDYCDHLWQRKWALTKDRLYLERLRWELYTPVKPLKMKLLGPALKLLFPSSAAVVQKREKLYRAKSGTVYAVPCGCWGMDEIHPTPADWYAEGTQLQFEGISVIAPKEYDKLLTVEYGDYMKLPPIEQRVSHHATEAIDLHTGYAAYLRDFQAVDHK